MVKWNRSQLLPTFNTTITVLNKLKGKHSVNKLDVWKKTVLHNCFFSNHTTSNVSSSSVVFGGNLICRIPKNNDYRPYNNWVNELDGFTFSTGDYVIKGVVEEIVTPENIKEIIEKYKPNAFEIRSFKDNTGTVEFLEHYHIEGV